MAAAAVQGSGAVIENSLYWSPVASVDEGRYVCAVLNAPAFGEMVRPYQSTGAFGPRHFHKHVWLPPTPLYDGSDPLHRRLADLATEAEAVAAKVAPPAKGGFQAHRRAVRDALAAAGISERLDEAVRRLL